jgi:hypothetical protein
MHACVQGLHTLAPTLTSPMAAFVTASAVMQVSQSFTSSISDPEGWAAQAATKLRVLSSSTCGGFVCVQRQCLFQCNTLPSRSKCTAGPPSSALTWRTQCTQHTQHIEVHLECTQQAPKSDRLMPLTADRLITHATPHSPQNSF